MTARRRLPNRRASELFDFTCGGFRYTAGVSRFRDGSIAEIFLTNGKVGSAAAVAAQDAAIVASLALQSGVPLETMRMALARNSDGSPFAPLGVALDLVADRDR